MPHIEENDLLSLHKEIEREQQTNLLLLDQVKVKNKELRRATRQLLLFRILGGIFAVAIVVMAFLYYRDTHQLKQSAMALKTLFEKNGTTLSETEQRQELVQSMESYLEALKKNSGTVNPGETPLPDSVAFSDELARLFAGKTLYSVQIGRFKKKNLLLLSKDFIHFKGYLKDDLYAYSLGNFSSHADAEILKEALVEMGFHDAFVVTYPNETRQ